MERQTKILAVAGKGGVGKTSISSAFVRLLTEAYPDARILAIDADPAVGLSTALGVEVRETLDDIRKSIVASVEDGAPREAIALLREARYRIFDTMVEQQKFSFLAIGRPESAGCYCKVNAYLKEVINLLSHDFDYVIIDTPPVNIVTDASVISDKITGYIFVVQSGKNHIQDLKDAFGQIEEMHGDIVGIILNDPDNKAEAHYSYRYNKYFRYDRYKYYGESPVGKQK